MIDPDFPTQGANIAPLLADPTAFRKAIEDLLARLDDVHVDLVVGFSMRGFVVATAIQLLANVPQVMMIQDSKLPDVWSADYVTENGELKTLHYKKGAILPGQRVLLVDDVLAGGGSMCAAISLVHQAGGVVVGVACPFGVDGSGGTEKVRVAAPDARVVTLWNSPPTHTGPPLSFLEQTERRITALLGKAYRTRPPYPGMSRARLVLEDIAGLSASLEEMHFDLLNKELSWINTEVLPISFVETMTISTETLVMERSLPARVPQFGVATMARPYKLLKNTSKTQIYAGAITVESELYDLHEAVRIMTMQMQQIVGGHMLILSLMAYERLLQCNDLQFRILTNGRNSHTIKARMEHSINMYAMPHKYRDGMFKYVQEYIHLMEAGLGQKKPTHCIVPPGKTRMLVTASHGSGDTLTFHKGYDDKVPSIPSVCGVQIREAPAEYSETMGLPILVSYPSYVADHHLLKIHGDSMLDRNGLPYIGIYDISQDQVVDVMFKDALEACGRFKKEEPPSTHLLNSDELTHLWKVVVSPDTDVFPLAEFRDIAQSNLDPFVAEVGGNVEVREYWHLNRNYHADLNLAEAPEKFVIPRREKTKGRTLKEWTELVCFLLARPMRGTNMQSMVFAAGSKDLGITAYKPTQFVHGVDPMNNTQSFRNQLRACCHITNPFLAAVGENALYAGVLNGGNARLIDFKAARDLASDHRYFENTSERDPSVYSICIPLHPVPRAGQSPLPVFREESRICLRGVLSTAPEDTSDIPGHLWCNKIFGWDVLNVGSMGEVENVPIAMMSCRGWSNYPSTEGGRREITGTGHHGMYEGPGTRGVRMEGFDVYHRLM